MTETDEMIHEALTSDLSWLPRVCEYCKAPAELVLDDAGDEVDKDGTFVIKFLCRNCGEVVRVRTPVSFFGDMAKYAYQ